MHTGWKHRLAILGFFFALAALLCQLQYEKATRPESPPVLKMYMNSDLSLLFTSRFLPRAAISAIQALSGGRLSPEHANALLQLLCIWGYLYLTFEFARRYLLPVPALAATFLAAIYSIWGLLDTASLYTYPYDFPAILFSVAGLLAIAMRRYGCVCCVVFFGTLNKETVAWLVPAYFFVRALPGSGVRQLFLQTAGLVLLFAAAYELPRTMVDPARGLQLTLQPMGPEGARYLNNLKSLLFLNQRNIFTNVWYPFVLHVPAMLGFACLGGDLRRMYWATPFLLLPLFVFGNINEARLFNEIVPLGAVATLFVFTRWWCAGATAQTEEG